MKIFYLLNIEFEKMRRKMRNKIIKISIITLIFIITVSLFFSNAAGQGDGEGSGEACHDCHGTDGDYTFEPIYIHSSTPRVVNPDEDFNFDIVLDHPGEYFASSIIIQVDLTNAPNLVLSSSNEIIISQMGRGSRTETFKIKAKDQAQFQRIKTTVSYNANFHYDPTEYIEILEVSITVDKILLSPSVWSVDLESGDSQKIDVQALGEVQNLMIIPSPSLEEIAEVGYSEPQQMNIGNTFTIDIKAKNTGNGKLNFVYEDSEGNPHKATMDIMVSSSAQSRNQIWVQMGMITGISSWVLLFMMTLIGVPLKKLKSPFNKIFKNAVIRKETHCWICYSLVILAVFHGLIVMTNHWNGAMLGRTFIFADTVRDYGIYVNLGTIAWLMMIIVSVTGIFWKQIIKLIKYNTWRYTHSAMTLVALITAISHGAVLLHARFF
jgi:hypothetical protein